MNRTVYMIWSQKRRGYVKYGVNGGGEPSFCQYVGMPVAFMSREEAWRALGSFTRPYEFKIVEFTAKREEAR